MKTIRRYLQTLQKRLSDINKRIRCTCKEYLEKEDFLDETIMHEIVS